MGMYTHLVLNVNFATNTPKEIIDTVRYMVGDTDMEPPVKNHPLFKCDRWAICLCCDSCYFMGHTNTSMTFVECLNEWQLTVNSNCKNYLQEYQHFLDYIEPYIEEKGYLGFIRYEEDDHPTLIYNTYNGIEYVTPTVDLKGDLW